MAAARTRAIVFDDEVRFALLLALSGAFPVKNTVPRGVGARGPPRPRPLPRPPRPLLLMLDGAAAAAAAGAVAPLVEEDAAAEDAPTLIFFAGLRGLNLPACDGPDMFESIV